MSNKIQVDMPHSLGVAEARRRIGANIDQLGKYLPGQANVRTNWEGNRLNLNIGTMGQEIVGRIDVAETVVHVEVDLPPMLAFFAKPIEALLAREGATLLEDKSKGR
jgi:hypothetical protein